MPSLDEAVALIRHHADTWGLACAEGLSVQEVDEARKEFESTLRVPYPTGYDQFLALSNGLETQRGILFNAASLQKWNEEHWQRIPTMRKVEDGVVFESFPDPNPRAIEYLWIGSYGNMDMYSFHLATRQYQVTNLSFEYIYGRFEQLAEFLLYLADPRRELAGTTEPSLES